MVVFVIMEHDVYGQAEVAVEVEPAVDIEVEPAVAVEVDFVLRVVTNFFSVEIVRSYQERKMVGLTLTLALVLKLDFVLLLPIGLLPY